MRQFIEEVRKQDRLRVQNDGTIEDYPIRIPGIGLHAIQEKQKLKEEKAKGTKARNPKFTYQKEIADHFLRDEQRFKTREAEIFEQMEDLLDDERIRGKVDKLEQDASKAS